MFPYTTIHICQQNLIVSLIKYINLRNSKNAPRNLCVIRLDRESSPFYLPNVKKRSESERLRVRRTVFTKNFSGRVTQRVFPVGHCGLLSCKQQSLLRVRLASGRRGWNVIAGLFLSFISPRLKDFKNKICRPVSLEGALVLQGSRPFSGNYAG